MAVETLLPPMSRVAIPRICACSFGMTIHYLSSYESISNMISADNLCRSENVEAGTPRKGQIQRVATY